MKNRIKELRQKKHLTQKELDHKVKLSVGAISGYETGARNPDYETWDKLADYFDVSIEYLKGYVLYMCKNCGRCFTPEPNASRKDMEYCPNCIDWLSL